MDGGIEGWTGRVESENVRRCLGGAWRVLRGAVFALPWACVPLACTLLPAKAKVPIDAPVLPSNAATAAKFH